MLGMIPRHPVDRVGVLRHRAVGVGDPGMARVLTMALYPLDTAHDACRNTCPYLDEPCRMLDRGDDDETTKLLAVGYANRAVAVSSAVETRQRTIATLRRLAERPSMSSAALTAQADRLAEEWGIDH